MAKIDLSHPILAQLLQSCPLPRLQASHSAAEQGRSEGEVRTLNGSLCSLLSKACLTL